MSNQRLSGLDILNSKSKHNIDFHSLYEMTIRRRFTVLLERSNFADLQTQNPGQNWRDANHHGIIMTAKGDAEDFNARFKV